MPRARRFVNIHVHFLLYGDDIAVIITLVTPLHTFVTTAGAVGFIIYVDPPRVPRYRLRYPKAR
jgi:hypothetical protein